MLLCQFNGDPFGAQIKTRWEISLKSSSRPWTEKRERFPDPLKS